MLKNTVVVVVLTLLLASFVSAGIERAGCDVGIVQDDGHVHFRKFERYDFVNVYIDLVGLRYANSNYSLYIHERIIKPHQCRPPAKCLRLGPSFNPDDGIDGNNLGYLGSYMSHGHDLEYESKLYVLTLEVANATNNGIIGRSISVQGPDGHTELCCKIYDGDDGYAEDDD